MKNKVKFIGILIGAIILVLVGFGLGKGLRDVEIGQLKNQVASFQEQIKELQEKTGEESKCFTQQVSPTVPTRLATVTLMLLTEILLK